MPIAIPSWLFSVPPTAENLAMCRVPGLIQDAVKTYPNATAYWQATNFGPLPPRNGPPKYWADPSGNLANGYACLDGTVHAASKMSLFENSLYSQNVRNFYAERPSLLVPTLIAVQNVSVSEWLRLSFEDAGIEDPAEFPLALIYDFNPQAMRHTFPTDMVLWHDADAHKPMAAKLDEAKKLFPLMPQMPIGPGAGTSFTAAQVVAFAKRMNSGSVVRKAAQDIYTGTATEAEMAGKLVAL